MSKTLHTINEIDLPNLDMPTGDLVDRVRVAARDEGGHPAVLAECDRIDEERMDWSNHTLANRLRTAYNTDQQTKKP